MKYCVVEFEDGEGEGMAIGRIAGPYSLRDAMLAAERLANEAVESIDDDSAEAKELDALECQHITGDSAGTFGVEAHGEPVYIYAVRELLTA